MEMVKNIKVTDNSEREEYAVHYTNYRLLYDLTPHSYFTLDRDGNILELNPNGCKMIGLDENLARNNFIRYVTHDTQAIFSEFFEKTFYTHEKQTCKVSIANQKNPEIFTSLEGMSFDEGSKCLLMAIDITDYEMLKRKATRYQNIFESLKHGILSFNATSGKITDVNQTLSKIFEIDSEKLMGKYIWEVPFLSEIIKSEQDLQGLENNLKNHYTIQKEDKTLELEVMNNVYEFGNSKEIQLNFRDIGERIRYLKALEESKTTLEELNTAKDKFFAIISHDLKSPFNSILGFAELLNEKIDKEEYTKAKQYSNIIQKSSWNAIDLLSNLLEWSRSQNNKIEFNPECFSLKTLLDEVLKFSGAAAMQKSVTVEKEIDSISLVADKAMINTVLRNLISNAIKFTNLGGKIKVNAIRKKDSVQISVTDNGIGIKPQQLQHLFDIGEKHSTKGTMQETGTGLGLVLCKEFVQKHNGTIWANSKVGEGSSFHFTIPT